MEILYRILDDLKETYGPDVAYKAIFAGIGAAFLITAILLQSQQPVIIINDIKEDI